jgi:hypothetical protein
MFLIIENDDDVYFQKTICMYVLDVSMGRLVKTYTPQSMRYFVAQGFFKKLKNHIYKFQKRKKFLM